MKDNLRRLNRIAKLFPNDAFYVYSIGECDITLQGFYKPDIVKKIQRLKFSVTANDQGFTIGTRGPYRIVLT